MEVNKRSELVFLYDMKDANPNGDPLEENKPRIDEDTETNIVTDVRLKRTIRDYLKDYKNLPVWVVGEVKEDGTIKTREEKLSDAKIKSKEDANKLIEKYIDLRLFGATIAGKKGEGGKGEKVFTWIGPVQFKFGRSLHRVEPKLIKGTSVLPTKEKKAGGSFTEAWILPYSLIAFYGIINENSAKYTRLTEEDVDEMLDAMWNGTKNLITRTKVGQMPRFLLRVIYREKNYHIGDLDKKIDLIKSKDDKELRNITDVIIDLTRLHNTLVSERDKIERVEIEANEDVRFKVGEDEYTGREVVNAFNDVNAVLKELDR